MIPAYDPDDNSRRCYDFAIAAAREKCVRSGQIKPRIGDEREQRWAKEGPVANSQLETVQGVPFQ